MNCEILWPIHNSKFVLPTNQNLEAVLACMHMRIVFRSGDEMYTYDERTLFLMENTLVIKIAQSILGWLIILLVLPSLWFRFPESFWTLFSTSFLVSFFCTLSAVVELLANSDIAKQRICTYHKLKKKKISRQWLALALDPPIGCVILVFCKLQFGYQAARTAITYNNLLAMVVNSAVISAFWFNEGFSFISKVFLSTKRQ